MTAGGSAGRVIAGTARGIRLVSPGEGTRALGDRVKQTLFAILEPEVRGGAFLDLFAGSGAAGIEALSRGAARAAFVESDRRAADVIERNLAAAHLAGATAHVVRADAVAWLRREGRAGGAFDAAIVDPPYDRPNLAEAALAAIAEQGPGAVLARDGVAVAKHFHRTPPAAEIGLLRSVRERRFGDTVLTFYRWGEQEDR